ncbi:MAG: MBL fold metallo-hydrolase [Dehalococcoidia bacterium]
MTTQRSSEAGVMEVGDGIFARLGGGTATNAAFILCDDTVVVIDSLMTPTLARNLLADVQQVTNKEIGYLVNTHHHGDHVFGNDFFPSARVIAHYKCRQVLAEAGQHFIRQFAQGRPELAPELATVNIRLPDATFSDRLTLYLGERQLELIHTGHGHTPDDIVIHLPQERMVFCGDLLFAGIMPVMRDGNSQGWMEAIGQVLALDAATVVPGHGHLSTGQDLVQERQFLAEMRQAVLGCFRRGMSEQEAIQAVRMDEYGGWLAQERLPIGISRIYAELSGGIR